MLLTNTFQIAPLEGTASALFKFFFFLELHQIQCKFFSNSTKKRHILQKIDANKVPKGAGTKLHKCFLISESYYQMLIDILL